MKKKQRSFLIIFVVILAFITLLFRNSILQHNEQKTLGTTISDFEGNNRQLLKLDTVTLSLQIAENNFRMYTSSWKSEYFAQYLGDLKQITAIISGLSVDSNKDIEDKILSDLSSKRHQMLLFGELKKSIDSINNINLQFNVDKINSRFSPANAFAKPVIKKVVEVEELKTESHLKKRKLFQRIKRAILNKPELVDSSKVVKKATTYELLNSGALAAKNEKQIQNVGEYYKTLFENQKITHSKLTEKEQAILVLNERIFNNIKLLFNAYKNNVSIERTAKKIALENRAKNALENISRSGKLNFSISFLSYFVILFLLYMLYRAYNKTIIANNLAAEQVASKSRFFTSISHEMRTPLNAIMGVAEQLKSTPLNENQRAMSVLLDNSSSMLLSAVNEVLDFSRLETKKLSLAIMPFSYKRILKEVVDATKVLADKKNIELELYQDTEPDFLLDGDPYRLKQIVMNLTANAIKFTDNGKVSIKVTLKKTDEKQVLLLIKIIDTGIGIAPENLPVIFNEFSQVIDANRDDWQGGSGLGLAICKKLIDLHQGKIKVESVLGKGTTFSVKLPYKIAEQKEEVLIYSEAKMINSDRFRNIRVLIVDDSEMNLLVVKMIFNKREIRYDTAISGKDALELIEQNKYDLVLTDIDMPEMDGMEFSRRVRENSDLTKARIPMIAITGHVNIASHEAYHSAGLNDYVIKPFTEMELIEKILDYVD